MKSRRVTQVLLLSYILIGQQQNKRFMSQKMFGCSGLKTLLYRWRAATTRNTFHVCIRRLPNHIFSDWILLFYCWILFFYYFCLKVKYPYVKRSYKQVLFIQKKYFLMWKHNRGCTIEVLKSPLPAYIFFLIPLSCLCFFRILIPPTFCREFLAWILRKTLTFLPTFCREFVSWILRKTKLHTIGFMLMVLNITINDYNYYLFRNVFFPPKKELFTLILDWPPYSDSCSFAIMVIIIMVCSQ